MTRPRFSSTILAMVALIAAAATITAQNVLVSSYFPHLRRFSTDFSPKYLLRELEGLEGHKKPTIFLGDSVLWGYRLRSEETAAALLVARGCVCYNFAFKSGNLPNDYAIVRLIAAKRVRPLAVVIEVNQKVFNVADPAYQTLHPAVATLAEPLLTADDRARIGYRHAQDPWYVAALNNWVLYAMRADVREALFGDAEPIGDAPPTAADFEGSYNLHPLDENNVAVHFLQKTIESLRAEAIPTIAFMTPTNHRLLHEYIDNASYRANSSYLRRLLELRGVRVLDLDRAFSANDFFDNDHLNAPAQRRLAAILGAALAH